MDANIFKSNVAFVSATTVEKHFYFSIFKYPNVLFLQATLTFSKCLEMKLAEHIDKIAKVAEVAGKEYSIEQALDKMEKEWEPINFEVIFITGLHVTHSKL